MGDLNAERECLALVNKLIVRCELPHPRIGKLSALSTQLVLMLFEACCGVKAPVVVENPRTRDEEALNVQAAIDVLSHRVLLMSLSHIDARDVVACDAHVVSDLMEILAGCLEVRNCASVTSSSTLSSPDSSLPVSTSEGEPQRNVCRCCNGSVTGRSTPIDDSDSPYSETSCFLCNYVAARERSRRMGHGPSTLEPAHPSPIPPGHQRIDSDTASCPASSAYETAESCLDQTDAKRFAHGVGSQPGMRTYPGQRRRQGSPYWLRGSPKPEHEPTESDIDVERLKATMAEIRQRLAATDKNADADRPVRTRLRTVKKSVLLSPSLQAARRGSGGTPRRKRLRSELDVEPSAEGSSTDTADLSPHAERVLQRLHEQHVRFVVRASSSAADVATDADRLQREHEELLQRHAQKLQALQRDLAHSRRLNDLETQRQLHLAIAALENDRRQQAAQLKRHHDERDRIMRSRRLSHRHKQQQMLQEAFKESVHARKADLAEIRASVRERQVRERDRHRVYLASLENFYQTQLSLLTESLAKEKSEMRQRAQAQTRVLERMRRDFKEQLEAETQNLYSLVAQKPHEGWVSTSQAVPSRKRTRRT